MISRRELAKGQGIPQKIASSPPGPEGEAARLLSRHLSMTSAKANIKAAMAALEMHPDEPLQLALVSGAQLCLFDNFLHYFRLHQLVVFNTDRDSFDFCQKRSGALATRFTLYCAEPVPCQ